MVCVCVSKTRVCVRARLGWLCGRHFRRHGALGHGGRRPLGRRVLARPLGAAGAATAAAAAAARLQRLPARTNTRSRRARVTRARILGLGAFSAARARTHAPAPRRPAPPAYSAQPRVPDAAHALVLLQLAQDGGVLLGGDVQARAERREKLLALLLRAPMHSAASAMTTMTPPGLSKRRTARAHAPSRAAASPRWPSTCRCCNTLQPAPCAAGPPSCRAARRVARAAR